MNEDVIIGGGVIISTFTMSNLLLFNDDIIMYISIAGSIISFLGTLTLLNQRKFETIEGEPMNMVLVILWLLKAIIFGAIFILVWFFVLKSFGSSLILEHFDIGFDDMDIKMIDTMWLLVSGLLTWYSIPISNLIFKKATKGEKV